jgi:hypothetical protein
MADKKKFQTAKDIVIPKGTRVVYIGKMRQEITNVASVLMGVGKHAHFDWMMHFDDALEAGLIEEVEEGPKQ